MSRMVGPSGKVIGIDVVEPLVKWAKENINRDDEKLMSSGVVQLKGEKREENRVE